MATLKLIPVKDYCRIHGLDVRFVQDLSTNDIVELQVIKRTSYIPVSQIPILERAIRISNDLEINVAGISTIFSLLQRLEDKEKELRKLRSRLNFLGDED